ncbi:MAG: hypothetical protein VX265_08470 [Myxococcota bacterium]|nr:hypothetical protein [Myxococcota bacterium]
MAKPMTPHPRRHYVDGASLADTEALLRWLQTSDGRALRLPVAVTFDDDYRLAIQSARVGGIPLKLDDTAMSVALLEQVRAICADGEPGCTVWLEGTWGSVLQGATMPGMGGPDLSGPGAPPASGPIRHPFAVRKVGERIEHAPVFAQIEGPSMDRP